MQANTQIACSLRNYTCLCYRHGRKKHYKDNQCSKKVNLDVVLEPVGANYKTRYISALLKEK